MNENVQPEQSQQPSGEGVGMSKQFSENPSMELLNNRRIDQIVAKREAERNAVAEGMANAENKGIEQGIVRGRDEGFIAGHNVGLEGGFERGRQYSGSGLGSSLSSNVQIEKHTNVDSSYQTEQQVSEPVV